MGYHHSRKKCWVHSQGTEHVSLVCGTSTSDGFHNVAILTRLITIRSITEHFLRGLENSYFKWLWVVGRVGRGFDIRGYWERVLDF